MNTVLMVSDSRGKANQRAQELAAGVASDGGTRLTVVGVPQPSHWSETFGPMSGGLTVTQIRADAAADAEVALRACLAWLPEHLEVRHLRCSGWRDPALTALLREPVCTTVIVAGHDLRGRARRALRALLRSAGVDLVLVPAPES